MSKGGYIEVDLDEETHKKLDLLATKLGLSHEDTIDWLFRPGGTVDQFAAEILGKH